MFPSFSIYDFAVCLKHNPGPVSEVKISHEAQLTTDIPDVRFALIAPFRYNCSMEYSLRPAQQAVLAYDGGKMGISAVPGSGKTFILSFLAAQLVNRGVAEDQEILVVTFSNSAVYNIKRRIGDLVRAHYDLLPNVGYRVRTLHGLAHDIVRERPGLAGLSEDFSIVDEQLAAEMRQEAAQLWLQQHPYALDCFVAPDLMERELRRAQTKDWPNLVSDIADRFISRAKDLQLSPSQLRRHLHREVDGETHERYPLFHMGLEIYEDYQRALSYRGGVDFDDLIRLALDVLQSNPDVLQRLCDRWPFILEDEAQDSSYLQEKILLLLSEAGNWVRVGDPNQAINTTFTTADPHFLRTFLTENDVRRQTLPDSGRSTQRIIDLANYLVDWTCDSHPNAWLRGESAAFLRQHIQPTSAGDPQGNPEDKDSFVIYLGTETYKPDVELRTVARSIARWLPKNRDSTVAVLVPINVRGFRLSEMLRAKDIPCEELLRSTARTRRAAGVLEAVLRFLAYPLRQDFLARAFVAWDETLTAPQDLPESEILGVSSEPKSVDSDLQNLQRRDQQEKDLKKQRDVLAKLLRSQARTEVFLFPHPGVDWSAPFSEIDQASERLVAFREAVRRWLGATVLPIDQLLITLAQDLFNEPSDLALAYKLALVLRTHATQYPDKRLPELAAELALIARNERRFLGFDDAEMAYQPQKGVVTISTMHKAKGLEWDRVYLVGVNNYNFPSAEAHDSYRGENWFVQDRLNLEAEAIAQLECLHEGQLDSYILGEATEKARIEFTAERLRLLYVGITRAKKELIITCNSGRQTFEPKEPAAPLIALDAHWGQRDSH